MSSDPSQTHHEANEQQVAWLYEHLATTGQFSHVCLPSSAHPPRPSEETRLHGHLSHGSVRERTDLDEL